MAELITVLGKPGAGKGTQAKKIATNYSMAYVSTGQMLRNHEGEIKYTTKHGKTKKEHPQEYLKEGSFVPDPMIISILKEKINNVPDGKGIVLDGFPRSKNQAEYMEKSDNSLDLAIYLNVSDDEVKRRLENRRICTHCDATYHLEDSPPAEDMSCKSCGGNVVQRDDDKPETIEDRLDIYQKTTEPLISHYHEQGILKEVDGEQSIQKVWQSIQSILEKEY